MYFIRPILEYGDIVWDNLTNLQSQKIENIQLEAARIITGGTKLTSHANLYKETGWQTLSCRRKHHKIIKFQKIVNNITPQYLRNILPERHSHIHQHNTRDANRFRPVRCRTNLYQKSFLSASVNLWNELPEDKRNDASIKY